MSARALQSLLDAIDWADQSPVTWQSLREKLEKAVKNEEYNEYSDSMGEDM
jgi:hypothetical protein